ncbi:PAS domain-containing protein [Rhodococcus sp. WB9]|uniref:PAS domain-containing protein n=1 Tax=Rhodococcus sp. WB9 TaxID=2594007 RepID=UPI0037CB405E
MEALPDSGMLLAVLEHTPALVFVSGRIVYVNPAGVGLLGLGHAVRADDGGAVHRCRPRAGP